MTQAILKLAWSVLMILAGAWALGIAEGYLPHGSSRSEARGRLQKLRWLFYLTGVSFFLRGIVALESHLVTLLR